MKTLEERFKDWFFAQVTRWGVPEDLTFDELKSIAHEAYMAGYGECNPQSQPSASESGMMRA